MTENMSTVDLKSLLEKRHQDKIEQDGKTEREQLLREIGELDNSASSMSVSNISASSVHPSGKTRHSPRHLRPYFLRL